MLRIMAMVTTGSNEWMWLRPTLCTYRLNWARRTSWWQWDEWHNTALQTQDSKFEPWRSEAELAISWSRRLPTILNLYECIFFLECQSGVRTRDHRLSKQAVVTSAPVRPPPCHDRIITESSHIILMKTRKGVPELRGPALVCLSATEKTQCIGLPHGPDS